MPIRTRARQYDTGGGILGGMGITGLLGMGLGMGTPKLNPEFKSLEETPNIRKYKPAGFLGIRAGNPANKLNQQLELYYETLKLDQKYAKEAADLEAKRRKEEMELGNKLETQRQSALEGEREKNKIKGEERQRVEKEKELGKLGEADVASIIAPGAETIDLRLRPSLERYFQGDLSSQDIARFLNSLGGKDYMTSGAANMLPIIDTSKETAIANAQKASDINTGEYFERQPYMGRPGTTVTEAPQSTASFEYEKEPAVVIDGQIVKPPTVGTSFRTTKGSPIISKKYPLSPGTLKQFEGINPPAPPSESPVYRGAGSLDYRNEGIPIPEPPIIPSNVKPPVLNRSPLNLLNRMKDVFMQEPMKVPSIIPNKTSQTFITPKFSMPGPTINETELALRKGLLWALQIIPRISGSSKKELDKSWFKMWPDYLSGIERKINAKKSNEIPHYVPGPY